MQRILSSPTFLLMFLCSYAWTSQFPSADEIDSVRRLVLYGSSPRRFQLFEYGRRPFEEDRESLEDFSSIPSTNIDYYNDLDKRVVGNGNKYTFGLGKRSKSYGFGLGKRAKAYGFGLGKRLQKDWKNSPALLSPNYRQERRSKVYSFGLGKRSAGNSLDLDKVQEGYYEGQEGPEKSARLFSVGPGKMEVNAGTS